MTDYETQSALALRAQALMRLREMKKYQWLCPNPECDGKPHEGMPDPHARAKQRPPQSLGAEHDGWLILAGRGFGKTRSVAEWAKARMLSQPKHRLAIIAPDFGAGRDICVEGESGLLAVLPDDRVKSWNRSLGELILTNGSVAKIFGTNSEADADALRGPQFHSVWGEEMSSWRWQEYAWDMAKFGLRLGNNPQWCVSTTPKNQPLLRSLVDDDSVFVTTGSTYENVDNLAPQFIETIRKKYEGTRLGQQEIYAVLLQDVEGALWKQPLIDDARISEDECPEMDRIIIAIDPAATSGTSSDETGIVVVGQQGESFYVLADLSGSYTPSQWATIVVQTFFDIGADLIVGETNNGGDMIETVIRSIQLPDGISGRNVAYRKVTATRGKVLRAEPIVSLYETKRVHHVGLKNLADLESQMTGWVPGPRASSPDRLDALVWGLTELSFGKRRRQLRVG